MSLDGGIRRPRIGHGGGPSAKASLTMVLLFVLGTSALYVQPLMHLAGERLLSGIDHVGALCITALHLLMLPAYRAFHVAIVAGIAYAIFDRVRAWRSLRRVLALLDPRTPEHGDAFWVAAQAAGISPGRLRVVAGLANPAFTAGLLSPRIYLAREVVDRLSASQLEAVIAHEASHVLRRDPLRLFVVRLVASAFFWIPALRRLEEDIRDEVELSADQAAARTAPLALASAILVLAEWNATPVPVVSVGFQGDGLLERRVRRLAGERTPTRSHLTKLSVAGAVLALGVLWSAALVVAHPMPNGSRGDGLLAHCHEHHGSALSHLFCLRGSLSPDPRQACPHHQG